MDERDAQETLQAAICCKMGLPYPMPPLIRGMPKGHRVEFSAQQAADYILLKWARAGQDTETQLIAKVQTIAPTIGTASPFPPFKTSTAPTKDVDPG